MLESKVNSKGLVMIALFTSFSIILGYIEFLIPFNIGIYGFKLGVANMATVIVLVCYGFKPALFVSTVRIVTINLLFGTVFSLLFSITAGLVSLFVMWLFYCILKSNTIFFSAIGGIIHNVVQLLVACFLLESIALLYLLPILVFLGGLTGILVGFISKIVIDRIKKYIPKQKG